MRNASRILNGYIVANARWDRAEALLPSVGKSSTSRIGKVRFVKAALGKPMKFGTIGFSAIAERIQVVASHRASQRCLPVVVGLGRSPVGGGNEL